MRDNWIKTGPSDRERLPTWRQYVGRTIVKLSRKEMSYCAWAGRTYCGLHETLQEAKSAAEQVYG